MVHLYIIYQHFIVGLSQRHYGMIDKIYKETHIG